MCRVTADLLGILARSTDLSKEQWLELIRQCVPPKTVEINLTAFELGYEA